MIAPLVAARSRDVAFVVMLAGPGVRGDSLLLLQARATLAASEVPSEFREPFVRLNERTYTLLRSSADSGAVVDGVRTAATEYVASVPDAARAIASALASQAVRSAAQMNVPWGRYFVRYDPAPTLGRVSVPVLAVNGTLDTQVPYRENLAGIEAALRAGGNRDHQVVALPNLNHLFQTATTGFPGEYGTIEETMSPAALDLVTRWITERFGGPRSRLSPGQAPGSGG